MCHSLNQCIDIKIRCSKEEEAEEEEGRARRQVELSSLSCCVQSNMPSSYIFNQYINVQIIYIKEEMIKRRKRRRRRRAREEARLPKKTARTRRRRRDCIAAFTAVHSPPLTPMRDPILLNDSSNIKYKREEIKRSGMLLFSFRLDCQFLQSCSRAGANQRAIGCLPAVQRARIHQYIEMYFINIIC